MQTVLQGMSDSLVEVGRRGMKMNVEKTKVILISGQPFLVQIVKYQQQLEKMEYFNYLSSLVTSDAR
jgi:hypothetical protein